MGNQKKIRIGTRPSKLALKQVEEVVKLLGLESFEIKKYDTSGDRDKITPISEIEGTDFFTDTIEKALIEREIDIAVHSAKDLPDKIKDGLIIAAITKSIDPYDVLVVRKGLNYKNLLELPYHAKIGTSSKRRKEQLKKYRNDFIIVDIRGNIEERIEKLDTGSDLDAIVIAGAGLIRLGLEDRITQRIPFEILKPHPLQGCLAIETQKDNYEIINLVKKINIRKGLI
ncbi:MAG: hydroxymethylbilane synthase [Candidatus Omnitrophica bacterium]|nr:hydroxymethylbilane synthase [Candidatus Omnitrophota bacterium]